MSQVVGKARADDTLSLKLVDEESPDRELLLKMYVESFPPDEWHPGMVGQYRTSLTKDWKTDEYLIMDGDAVIGLICIVHSATHAYMLYLAVSPQYQGKGYGSRVLTLFKKMYPNHIRFFDLEVPDESAANAQQRAARIRFYERNGYHLIDFVFEDNGVLLTVMTNADKFIFTREIVSLLV